MSCVFYSLVLRATGGWSKYGTGDSYYRTIYPTLYNTFSVKIRKKLSEKLRISSLTQAEECSHSKFEIPTTFWNILSSATQLTILYYRKGFYPYLFLLSLPLLSIILENIPAGIRGALVPHTSLYGIRVALWSDKVPSLDNGISIGSVEGTRVP